MLDCKVERNELFLTSSNTKTGRDVYNEGKNCKLWGFFFEGSFDLMIATRTRTKTKTAS